MPLESASTIDQLVVSNPTDTDPIAETDDHLRLIKGALKASFPKLVGATQATAAQLDAIPSIAASVATTAATLFPRTGGTISGDVGIQGFLATNGAITSQNGLYEASGRLVPRGIITLWYGSTASVPGGWQLCDGTNGAPDLRDVFVIAAGPRYPVGVRGGQESWTAATSASGNHNHGASTLPSGAHGHAGATDEQGLHQHSGLTQPHVLTVSEMPQHGHELPTIGNGGNATGLPTQGFVGGVTGSLPTTAIGGNAPHQHGIDAGGAHSHNVTVSGVGNHAHNIDADGQHSHVVLMPTMPPYVGVLYIMKS